jgi:type IVB pilus formation R64 PilN family outer membrane protein
MKRLITKTTAIALGLSMVGCTTPVVHKVEKSQQGMLKEADDLMQAARAPAQIEYASKSADVYFAGKGFVIKQDELPAVFKKRVTLLRDIDGMQGLVERISTLSGLPVQYARTAGGTPSAAAGPAGPMMIPSMPRPGSPVTATQEGATNPSTFTLNYDGTLEGLCNFLTTKYGYYYRVKDNVIQFYETDTRIFDMVPLPGGSSVASSVGLDSASEGGVGSGGGASQKTSSTAKSKVQADSTFEFWSKLDASLKPMLTDKAIVASFPATGMVSVTDTPEALDRVGPFLEAQNRFLSRQVAINVRIVSVENNDGDNYGINWDAVRSTLADKYNLRLKTNVDLGGTPSMTVDFSSGKFTGTQAVIGALSEKHVVHAITSASATGKNNHTIPVSVGTQRGFLEKITTTTDAVTGAKTYTLEPGAVRFGTTMTFTPKINADNTVELQFGLDMTNMIGDFRSFGPEGNQIQFADLDSKTFLQTASLRSGETLILAGYEDSKGSSDRAGVGSADAPVFGGQIKGNARKQTMVIMIQPVVMDANK